MKCFRIHLIRHGLTEGNIKGQYIGITDLSLTTNSIIEINDLKNYGAYPSVEAVYTSPLKRCKETADIIYPEKQIIPVEELKEYNFGEFEGKTANEIEDREEYRLWTANKISAPPGGEDNRDFAIRICQGMNKVIIDMSQKGIYEAAAIMHGGAIMSFLASCGFPQKNMLEWTTEFGKGYTILVTPSLYAKSGIVEVIDTVPSLEK